MAWLLGDHGVYSAHWNRLFGCTDADREPEGPARLSRRGRCAAGRSPAAALARGNTGRGAASPNGWWNGWRRTRPRWSASTTDFPSRCATSRRMDCRRTGRASSMISSATGRPTRITPMSISCAMASSATARSRAGNARWRRLTEERAGGAKSVFQFDVQGSVAKSTHAGIPWLRFIRQRLGARVHFWPFDGWDIPAGRSAIAEVYPALWSRNFAQRGPHRRSARRLQHRSLAFARRPGRRPRGLPEARPVAARAHVGAGGGLDFGRSRLDPLGQGVR